ncbi:hypothetical protein [Anatilimnocola floriformis]|uniref:hypothetical protein n=1 Tax=Anatilimnocola floriformis TaxID=2948575 RepID=UPI0020C33919|nr:hypothetical protein [Anatilimnocola floriformis]
MKKKKHSLRASPARLAEVASNANSHSIDGTDLQKSQREQAVTALFDLICRLIAEAIHRDTSANTPTQNHGQSTHGQKTNKAT